VSIDHEHRSDFPALSRLLGGDRRKVAMVAHVFYRSVAMDMLRLEGAASSADWAAVRMLANHIAIACIHAGEVDAAYALEPISNTPDDFETGVAFQYTYADTRADLIVLLERAIAYAE
jgi:hypothetical protein